MAARELQWPTHGAPAPSAHTLIRIIMVCVQLQEFTIC